MNTKRSLIVLSIFGILLGSAWQVSVAKQADEDEDSVRRWGRWAVLSPAAGQEETGGFVVPEGANLGSCESSENCPTIQLADTTSSGGGSTSSGGGSSTSSSGGGSSTSSSSGGGSSTSTSSGGGSTSTSSSGGAMAPCAAGAPCGFARIDYPYVSTRDGQEVSPDSSEITKAQLTLVEGEEGNTAQIVLDPTTGTPAGLDSGELDAPIFYSDVFVAMSEDSFLAGEIDGVVKGPWEIGVSGGEYVWGIAATEAQMTSLINGLGTDVLTGDKIATYTGSIGGSSNVSEPSVTLNINFTQNSWSGNFNNSQFTANGNVIDSGFVSTSVGDGAKSGLVHGAFVNAGNNAIGAYDVELTAGGRSADVFSTTLQSSQSPQ